MPKPETSTAPSPVFRETFLFRLRSQDRRGLEQLAKLLSEAPRSSDSEKSPVSQELEATLLDLEFAVGLLEQIESEPDRTQLRDEDIHRCKTAGTLARGLRKLLRETNA